MATCAVARNASDVRWLAALRNGYNFGFDPEKRGTFVALAIATSFLYCPKIPGEYDVKSASTLALDTIVLHPNSHNVPRNADEVADCIVIKSRSAALKYMEDVERRVSSDGGVVVLGDDDSKKAIDLLIKANPSCGEKIRPKWYWEQYLSLYSRFNWLLRAKALVDDSGLASRRDAPAEIH